jgi:hypothetical protein
VVSVRLTDQGPVLSLAGASLEIAATKTLSLSCDTLRIQAAHDAAVEVGGSLHERVRGSVVREAGKSARTTACEVTLEASPGGVAIRANDDVDIVGERVRLNSEDPPMPLSWEEFRARQALSVRVGRVQPRRERCGHVRRDGSAAVCYRGRRCAREARGRDVRVRRRGAGRPSCVRHVFFFIPGPRDAHDDRPHFGRLIERHRSSPRQRARPAVRVDPVGYRSAAGAAAARRGGGAGRRAGSRAPGRSFR